MNHTSYLDAARQGKASPGRYLVGLLLIFFVWLGIGSMATGVALLFFALIQGIRPDQFLDLVNDPASLGMIPNFITLNISFVLFFLGVWLAVRGIHRRRFRSVITGADAVNWKRVGAGFGAWFLVGILGSLVEYLLWPETFSVQIQPLTFLSFALVALILTPIQTTSEELFFRGYLVQAGSLLSCNPLFLSLLSGILFALPHFGNPEVAENALLVLPSYFILGGFLTWISLKDGTIELAIGLHAANNLFAGLVVTFPQSALQTPAIFYTTHFDPLFNLVALLIQCFLFYLLVFKSRRSLVGEAIVSNG